MKTRGILLPLIILVSVFTLTGCSAIEGIFKAGAWTGIIFVALIIGVVIFIISRLGKRS